MRNRSFKGVQISEIGLGTWQLGSSDWGEGCISIKEIRGWVEEAGFNGFNEVEIFSNIYWQQDQHLFLEKIKEGYLQNS